MRQLTDHKADVLNNSIEVFALGGAGIGGANNGYCLSIIRVDLKSRFPAPACVTIPFQVGPAENGINGYSNEALLAIVIDRLRGFQYIRKPDGSFDVRSQSRGEYSCRENAIALTHLEDAMHWLQHRTRERLARGVEGTSQK